MVTLKRNLSLHGLRSSLLISPYGVSTTSYRITKPDSDRAVRIAAEGERADTGKVPTEPALRKRLLKQWEWLILPLRNGSDRLSDRWSQRNVCI
jgi:hypothetical protein